ncbi:gluconokinase [Nocardioides sp.]|uniref:gluconokinase n=1 Tax=Nocardioides sp. TaxID=35761 RepID=UPI002EDA4E88
MSRHPLVVMGVSGSGKSTVGAALAQRLGVPFVDADDLHPASNIAKMSRGEPLDDEDRWPWLETIGRWLADHPDGGVVSCSALKRAYRDRLREHVAELEFVHLTGSREVIERRQASRPGHFMPASLLSSQFATLEPLAPDERGFAIDVDQSVDRIVQTYVDRVRSGSDTTPVEEN